MRRLFLVLSLFASYFPRPVFATVSSIKDCERILSAVESSTGGAKPDALDVLPEEISSDAGLPGAESGEIISSPVDLRMALSKVSLPAEQFLVLSKIPGQLFEAGAVIYISQLGVSIWRSRDQLNSWLQLGGWLTSPALESAQWHLADLGHMVRNPPGIPDEARSVLRNIFYRGEAIQRMISSSNASRRSLQRKIQEDFHLQRLSAIEDEDLFDLALRDPGIERLQWTDIRIPLEFVPASPSSPPSVQIPVRIAQNFLRTVLRLKLTQRLIGLDKQNKIAYLLDGPNAWLVAAFPELTPYFWNFPAEMGTSENNPAQDALESPLRDAGLTFVKQYEFGVGGANPFVADSTWARFLSQDLRKLGISSLRFDLSVTREIDLQKDAVGDPDVLNEMGVRLRMSVINGGTQLSERQKNGLKKLLEELMSRIPSLKDQHVKLTNQGVARVALDQVARARIDSWSPSLRVELEGSLNRPSKAALIYFYLMLKEFDMHRDLDFH